MNKQYLGDGVYVEFDGWGLTVTTENGVAIQNTVYLEPSVLEALVNYDKQMRNKNDSANEVGGS